MALAFVGEEAYDVASVGGEVDDVVGGGGGVEHAEAVVVFGGDDDVFHAGGLGQGYDLCGVEVGGVEAACHGLVVGNGYTGVVHDLLAVEGHLFALPLAGKERVDSKVDEEAEVVVAPCFEGLCCGFLYGVVVGCVARAGGGEQGGSKDEGGQLFAHVAWGICLNKKRRGLLKKNPRR